MFTGIIVGLILGMLAELLMPDRNPMGFIMSVALGTLGGLFAIYLGWELHFYQFHEPAAWMTAAMGAMLPIIAYQITRRRGF